jgi:hypothetical protein
MTPNEFKAWFDGFTEAFDRVPTKAQWARVKERVAEIDGKAVTERVYLDRYWPTYVPRYGNAYWPAGMGIGQATGCKPRRSRAGDDFHANTSGAVGVNSLNANSHFDMPQVASFNSTDAMYALGKADAGSLDS